MVLIVITYEGHITIAVGVIDANILLLVTSKDLKNERLLVYYSENRLE